jgi:hypothetical protein
VLAKLVMQAPPSRAHESDKVLLQIALDAFLKAEYKISLTSLYAYLKEGIKFLFHLFGLSSLSVSILRITNSQDAQLPQSGETFS